MKPNRPTQPSLNDNVDDNIREPGTPKPSLTKRLTIPAIIAITVVVAIFLFALAEAT